MSSHNHHLQPTPISTVVKFVRQCPAQLTLIVGDQMSSSLKINWLFFLILSCIVLAGTLVLKISSSSPIPIKLIKGQKTSISLSRIFPDILRLELWHKSSLGNELFHLGKWENPSPENRSENLFFSNPGQIVKLLVEGNSQSIIYEALPVAGQGQYVVSRGMIPYVDDGNPNLFHVPENHHLFKLQHINNLLIFTVFEVDEHLIGEEVELYIQSPITFKFTPNGGYRYFWCFHFFPFYIFILICYLFVLIYKTKISLSKKEIPDILRSLDY